MHVLWLIINSVVSYVLWGVHKVIIDTVVYIIYVVSEEVHFDKSGLMPVKASSFSHIFIVA